MSTTETRETGISPEVRADFDAVMAHLRTGKPLDPAIARRIHERAEKIRQRILQEQGVRDLGVEIIRELRGALPEP